MAQRRRTHPRLEDAKCPRLSLQELTQKLVDDASLADAGTAHQRHRARFALVERVLGCSAQRRQLRLAPDQRCAKLGWRKLAHGTDACSKDRPVSSLCWPDRSAWRRLSVFAPPRATPVRLRSRKSQADPCAG